MSKYFNKYANIIRAFLGKFKDYKVRHVKRKRNYKEDIISKLMVQYNWKFWERCYKGLLGFGWVDLDWQDGANFNSAQQAHSKIG